MKELTENEAYRQYQEYAKSHKPTPKDLLRTFSGWLIQFKVKLVEETA